MKRRIFLAVGGLTAAIALCAAAVSPDAERVDELKPVAAMSGPHSGIQYQAFAVIREADRFESLWTQHKGDDIERAKQGWPLVPEVDFEKYMVIALFRGKSTNCNGETILSMIEKDDHVLIRYDSVTFQTASADGEDQGVAVTPYGLAIVPRVDKAVIIEKNTQGLKNRPAKWTKMAHIGYPNVMGGWFIPGASQKGPKG